MRHRIKTTSKHFIVGLAAIIAIFISVTDAYADWEYITHTIPYQVEFTGNYGPGVTCTAPQAITLPTSTASVTGNATDSDGTIVSSTWAFQSGPVQATVATPTSNTVPHTTALNGMTVAGTYVFVFTATDNQNATNQCTSQIVVDAAVPYPDLTAGSISPTTATVGTAVQFSSTIQNTGSDTTGIGFYNLFQLSSNSSGTGAQTITPTLSTSALGAGASRVVSSSSYTFSTPGQYYVRACADKRNAASAPPVDIDEDPTGSTGGENNNCGSWTLINVNNPGGVGPVSVTLSGNGTTGQISIVQGNAVNLTWASSNADSCVGTNFGTNNAPNNVPSDSEPDVWVSPSSTTTYTINCTNAGGGSDSDQFTVNVTVIYQCSDGSDNDGDGLTDFGNDPGCSSTTDDSELDATFQCSDGGDNDGDGLIDTNDPGCHTDNDANNAATYNPNDNNERDPKKPWFWEF